MKLEDWFADLRAQRLSEKDKALMYSRILDKTYTSILTKRLQFYAKVGTLSIIILGIGVYLLSSMGSSTPSDGQLPILTLDRNAGNVVQADTIGRLINIQGSIAVFAGDVEINSETIVSGNTVYLQENARVELVVRQGVKAIITGPARFSMERVEDESGNNVVVLNLIEGSYFELVPVQTAEKEELALDEFEERTGETFVVKTSDFEIQQLPAQRDIHVTITKDESGNATLTNQGSDLIVKRLTEDKEEFTVIGQDEVAYIETDEIEKQLTDNQLTIRYETETTILPVETIAGGNDSVVDENEETEKSDDSNTDEDAVAVVVPSKSKRVLEKQVMDELQSVLVVSFAQKHLRDIAVYRATGESGKSDVALNTLISMVNRARGIVDMAPVGGSLVEIKSGLLSMKSSLDSEYYLSPSFIQTIDSVVAKIDVVLSIPVGVMSEHPSKDEYDMIIEGLQNQGFAL